jgi:hypothetical protein
MSDCIARRARRRTCRDHESAAARQSPPRHAREHPRSDNNRRLGIPVDCSIESSAAVMRPEELNDLLRVESTRRNVIAESFLQHRHCSTVTLCVVAIRVPLFGDAKTSFENFGCRRPALPAVLTIRCATEFSQAVPSLRAGAEHGTANERNSGCVFHAWPVLSPRHLSGQQPSATRPAVFSGRCPADSSRGGPGLAQLVEHVICNHAVRASNPLAGIGERS